MDIESRIGVMANPQEFTRLGNAVYAAEDGSDYQAINDDRADGGNDGYVISEKRLIARHCPKNRAKITDTSIMAKIRGDFAKALRLKDDASYPVEKWTFQTNYKPSEAIFEKLNKLAEGTGIEVSIQTQTRIADLFLKHAHLHSEFPELTVTDIAGALESIDKKLEDLKPSDSEPAAQPTASPPSAPTQETMDITDVPNEPPIKNDKEYQKVMGIIKNGYSEENRNKLKAIAYTGTSNAAKLQAILAYSNWRDVLKELPESMLSICDQGIAIAKQSKRNRELAVLLADKASYLSQIYTEIYIERHGYLRMAAAFGSFGGFSQEELDKFNSKIYDTDIRRIEAAQEALDIAQKSDYSTAAHVLTRLGQALAAVSSIQLLAGDKDDGHRNYEIGKSLLLEGIRCFGLAEDQEGLMYARHGLANQLRNHEHEIPVAIEIEQEVLVWAEANKDVLLTTNAKQMLHTMKTGEMPDYTEAIKELRSKR